MWPLLLMMAPGAIAGAPNILVLPALGEAAAVFAPDRVGLPVPGIAATVLAV